LHKKPKVEVHLGHKLTGTKKKEKKKSGLLQKNPNVEEYPGHKLTAPKEEEEEEELRPIAQ
jgi:hypothetical protein